MESAFWDSGAIVPLCIRRQASPHIDQLSRRYAMTVWRTSSVEAQSAFARELRAGILSEEAYRQAQERLNKLKGQLTRGTA